MNRQVYTYIIFTWYLIPTLALATNLATPPGKLSATAIKETLINEFKPLEKKIRDQRDNFLITSNLKQDSATGRVYAVLPYSINTVRAIVSSPSEWCKATIFHINIKSCTVENNTGTPIINLYIGDEDYTEPELAEKIQYYYKNNISLPDLINISLTSQSGPMDTGDYAIDLKVFTLGEDKLKNESLIRLEYKMKIGLISRTILKTYLATLGRDKVGFSESKTSTSSHPEFIGGIEGIMERNTMRYLFAFKAYLASRNLPDEDRFFSTMNNWFDYTLKYRKQLYEINRTEYIKRKLKENQNQLTLQSTLNSTVSK